MCVFLASGLKGDIGVNPPRRQEDSFIVHYATPYDISEFSPFHETKYSTSLWLSTCQVGLYERSGDANYSSAPMLATSLPVSMGNDTTWSVELKDGLHFSDGSDLTAYDIEYTYKLMLSPEVNYASYDFYSSFLNNESVRAVDDTLLVFNMTKPYAFIETLFSASVVPKAHYEARYDGEDYYYNAEDGSDTIGAGPFMVNYIDLTDHVVTVSKNPYFHIADHPIVDMISFEYVANKEEAVSQLADGTIDIMDSHYRPTPDDFESILNITEYLADDLSHQEMNYNHVHPVFGTGLETPKGVANASDAPIAARHVRYAMSHLINREPYPFVFQGLGIPGVTVMPQGIPGFDDSLEPRNYSVDVAQTYMEWAGFEYTGEHVDGDDDGVIDVPFFNVTLLSPSSFIASWIEDGLLVDLPKIGIGISEFHQAGWDIIGDRTFYYAGGYPVPTYDDGGFDIFFVGYCWDLDFDPSGLYDSDSLLPNGGNFYNWADPVYDALLADYLNQTDSQERQEKLVDWQHYFHENEIVSTIWYSQALWGVFDTISGFDPLLFSVGAPEWHLLVSERQAAVITTTVTSSTSTTSESSSSMSTTSTNSTIATTSTTSQPPETIDESNTDDGAGLGMDFVAVVGCVIVLSSVTAIERRARRADREKRSKY